MSDLDPFNRETWQEAHTAERDHQRFDELLRDARRQALMLLYFVQALQEGDEAIETRLSKQEALQLAGQVWRAS